jgi:ADP-heptose:LPS heptosyltransferase
MRKKFLIIQLRQVGDVLISTSLCETLKKNYPDACVDYVVYPYTEDMAKNNPYIDNVITIPNGFDLRQTFGFIKTIWQLRKKHYDYVIDVLNTPKSINFASLVAGKILIGQYSTKKRTNKYDRQVKYNPSFLANHHCCNSVKNRLCLLEPISDDLNYHADYKLFLTDDEQADAKHLLQQSGIDTTKPVFYFSIGSRSPEQKQWSLNYFVDVLKHCQQKHQAQIILCEQSKNAVDIQFIQSKVDGLCFIEGTNLRQLAAIIQEADMFVGNDSGPRHIAIAVNTPSVAIFSPAIDHADWAPANTTQHVSINIKETLNLSDSEFDNIRQLPLAKMRTHYDRLTPNYVKDAIDQLCVSEHIK